MMNRVRKARIQAGLSEGQAKRLLGVDGPTLARMEDMAAPVENAERLADLYGCGVAWLRGEGPDRDYATIDAMKGSENLCASDRDTLAEFAASLHGANPPKTLAQIAAERDAKKP